MTERAAAGGVGRGAEPLTCLGRGVGRVAEPLARLGCGAGRPEQPGGPGRGWFVGGVIMSPALLGLAESESLTAKLLGRRIPGERRVV